MFKYEEAGEEVCCVRPYDVILDKEYTVKEFVDTVLKTSPDEWGYFKMDIGNGWLKNPKYEYRYGKLLDEIPKWYLVQSIKEVKASGGWFNLDYRITFK